jgi:hypothetical protein
MYVHDGRFYITWLDTGKPDYKVSRERLALAVARPDDQAALAAAGWRAEWGPPPPVSTVHPSIADSATQEKGTAEITRRRSLHDSEPEAGFGEATLHERWSDERADADPADFAELQNKVDSTANNRTNALEQRLMQQMQQMQQQAHQQQQAAIDVKVASLEEKMEVQLREQQTALEEKMERQAEESNKRLDRLITLVSVMQAQQSQQAN